MATKKKMLQAAAGQAGGAGLDVTEVFSTYLYEGDGDASPISINNGISLGDDTGDGVYYQSSTSSVTGNLSPLSNITVTNTGGTSLDTSVAKFSSSYRFDGNADFLTLSQPVFNSATPFCFETWVNFNSDGASDDMGMIANQYTAGEAGRMLFGSQANKIVVRVNGGTIYLTTGPSSVSTNTWYHVAWTYDGTTHRLYLDGVLKDSDTTMPSIYTGTNTEIGGIDPTRLDPYDLFGRLEDIRVTLGKARYTGSSYTVPTAKFPQDTLFQGEGGLIWVKKRNQTGNHYLHDTSMVSDRYLSSNNDFDLQGGVHIYPNGTGFTSENKIQNNFNYSGDDFASWTFRKAPKFFDVVTYTGDGTDERDIAHNLGVPVGCLMVKCTSEAADWQVLHKDANRLILNSTSAQYTVANTAARFGDNVNITRPTATHFTVSTPGNADTNKSGATYVAYLFAHNDGDGEFGPDADQDIIKCGSYTGNGADQDIDIGFEPQWILSKPSTFNHDWYIHDTMRGFITYSGTDTNNLNLKPNEINSESDFDGISLKSNGIGLHGASNAANNNGETYIYIAIRRGPLAPPEDATEVFAIQQDDAGGTEPAFVSNFPVDFAIERRANIATNNFIVPRLTAPNFLKTESNQPENHGGANAEYVFDYSNGWNSTAAQNDNTIAYMWGRAPNFSDVVAYTGDGVAGRTVSHNLGVAPEMMWIKQRDALRNWSVYHIGTDATAPENFNLRLDATNDVNTGSTHLNSTAPTSSNFTLGSSVVVNSSGSNYIAYLFASLPGISKVGSFTKSATSIDIDCGFTTGARFILFKKTSGNGDWWVHDTVRGIVASAIDPYLKLNSTDAEGTNFNLVEPLASGFTITSALSSGDYIFYAIA